MSDKVISQRINAGLLLGLTAVVAVIFSLPRIPQPQSYHLFADHRSFLGIANFGDVVSNVPFGVIGVWGLLFLLRSSPGQLKKRFLDSRERWPYVLVFIGLLLTAFGSSYYHLSPNNARLVWDRQREDERPATILDESDHAASHQPCRRENRDRD